MLRHRLLLLLAVVTTLAAVPPAAADDFPAPLSSVELNDGDTFVFLGDSITHQCLYTQYVEDFFYTRFPNKRIIFHNAGVGGAKAWDALQRFDRDVADYKPKYVSVLLGMNDGAYRAFDEPIWQTYFQDMSTLIDRIQATGATPVLMTPTMFDNRARRISGKKKDLGAIGLYNGVLTFYGTWLRDVAEENGYGFVDMWSPLNNLTMQARKTDPSFTMIPDAVHPGPDGQLVMAAAMIEDLGLRKPLSNIRIQTGNQIPAAKKGPMSTASGGKVSDLTATDDGVGFTWTAEALPWVLPESTKQGAKLLHLGHRFTREALTVGGLPGGTYELLIDGNSVGTYTAGKLADGVELQDNAKTPQYQQAAQVAALNRTRNSGPVEALRGQWSRFQNYARTKADTANWENKEAAAEKLAQAEAQIVNMEAEVTKQEAAAKAIEDQIFEINQPKPHRYELKRAGKQAAANEQRGAVTGVVTYAGKPVEGALLRFIAEETVATGSTDDQGRFAMTSKNRPQVPVGTYRVEIVAPNDPNARVLPGSSQAAVTVAAGRNEMDFELSR